MPQPHLSDGEGLRLSLCRVRHHLGNSLMIINARWRHVEVTPMVYHQTLRQVRAMLDDCLDLQEPDARRGHRTDITHYYGVRYTSPPSVRGGHLSASNIPA